MNAKEYYESREWGNPHWDRKTATQFDKSEMLDFAEHYHQAKLKLLGIGIVVCRSEQFKCGMKESTTGKKCETQCKDCKEMYGYCNI